MVDPSGLEQTNIHVPIEVTINDVTGHGSTVMHGLWFGDYRPQTGWTYGAIIFTNPTDVPITINVNMVEAMAG